MGYSTDLTDKQWKQIEPIFASNKGQHLSKYSKRELINAVLYLVKTGCQWRLLPNDFPAHDAVWSFYHRAVKSGKWEKVMDVSVKRFAKMPDAKLPQPTDLLTHKAQKLLWLPMIDVSMVGKKSRDDI